MMERKGGILLNNLLEIRSDILFQDIFNEKNITLLSLLVAQLLKKKVEDVLGNFTIKNIRLPRTSQKSRQKYCDYVLLMDNTYIIIELNNNYRGISTRNDTYAFSVINNAYGIDEKTYYQKDIKTILFNLNWHYQNIGRKRKAYEVEYLKRTYHDNDYLLKIVNINLDYYVKEEYNSISEHEKIFKLLTITDEEELKRVTKGNKYLEKYCYEVIRIQNERGYKEMILSDVAERNLQEAEIAILVEEGRQAGMRSGMKKGIAENKQETILNMNKDHVPLNKISEYVNLAIDKVQKIIDKAKRKEE